MKNIVIWGRGELSESLAKVIKTIENDIYLIGFVDNNPVKEGQKLINKNILSLAVFKDKYKSQEIEYILVPAYPYLSKILKILNDIEISLDNIYIADSKSMYELINKYGTFTTLIQQREIKVPFILSLEYEVAHHCNLNCMGCNHFSPLQQNTVFGDLESFVKDLKRISELVECIGVIKLLGGEPLLNPQLGEFIKKAKEIFPNTNINVITNGILVKNMTKDLIEIIQKTNTVLELTIYPPMKSNFPSIEEYLINNNLHYEVFYEAKKFCSQINSKGDSNPEVAELNCASAYCHIFENGKLSKCALTHKITEYNKAFDTSIPQCSIDIYNKNLSPMDLYKYLIHPIEMCCFCGKAKWYSWQQTIKLPNQDEYECKDRFI